MPSTPPDPDTQAGEAATRTARPPEPGAPLRLSGSPFRARYSETDQMGFVYHAHYLVWCETGRTDFMRSLGTSYAELERDGLRLAVAEAGLRFHAPARYDDLVRVDTWLERVQSRAVTFGYEVLRVDGRTTERLVTASTKLIALGRDGAPCMLPAPLLQSFRRALAVAGPGP